MIACVQRVKRAAITVDSESIAGIGPGMLVLLGLGRGDTYAEGQRLIDKILRLRIFSDADDRMNLNLSQVQGELLLVSQFTLLGDTRRGNRPGFEQAMPPEEAQALYGQLCDYARKVFERVQIGRFGAHMQIELLNDGPVTFLLGHNPLPQKE